MSELTDPETAGQHNGEPEVEEAPYESESARYMRVRAEAKAQAAVTMAADAKKAAAAKAKRLRQAPQVEGQAEFLARAKEIEARINSKTEED